MDPIIIYSFTISNQPQQKCVYSYQVALLMYCFQESLPASRPPPVAFSPPNAPPISAPFVGMFTFTIPQSLPWGLYNKRSNNETVELAIMHYIWFALWQSLVKCLTMYGKSSRAFLVYQPEHIIWIFNKHEFCPRKVNWHISTLCTATKNKVNSKSNFSSYAL